MRETREEEIGSEEESNIGRTMLESFDFENVWTFNHPHLSMKEHQEKMHQVEVPIKKRAFQAFYEEEHNDYDYVLGSSLLQVWEYTKANQEKKFVPYKSHKQEQLEKEVILLGLDYFFVKIYRIP
jgi:hypothetical protein